MRCSIRYGLVEKMRAQMCFEARAHIGYSYGMKFFQCFRFLALFVWAAWPVSAQSDACSQITDVSAEVTPPALAKNVRACIAQGAYADAMAHFYVWSAHGLFDQQRVKDASAHIVLREGQAWIFGGWPSEDMAGLRDVAQAMARPDDENLQAVCAYLAHRGPPDYRPGYMIARGQIPRKSDEDWRVVDFDADAAWDAALHELNNCPRP